MTNSNLLDFSSVTPKASDVVVMELKSEKETVKALKALQERKLVVLLLGKLSEKMAQRVIDWMTGGTCAIDGRTVWIGEKTFLFAPNNVCVTALNEMLYAVAPNLRLNA
jgi:cell division inhibitor SepF